MDEYKEYLYKRRPHYKRIDAGDLTQQKKIREDLKCKSFKWFMTEIAFDLVNVYPPVEPPDFYSGKVSNFHSLQNVRFILSLLFFYQNKMYWT